VGGRSLNDEDDDPEFSGEYAESPARLTRHRIPATRVEGGTMAWDRGKRNRRDERESDEGLGKVTANAVAVVVVEKRRIARRAQEEEMTLAISHFQCLRIRVFACARRT